MHASNVDLNTLLKSRAGTGAHRKNRRVYGALVIVQIAFTLPLVCAAILTSSIEATATFVNNIADLLDLQRVVFGGPAWPVIEKSYLAGLPPLIAALRQQHDPLLHEVEMRSSIVGTDVAAVGAACLVLDSFLSPRSAQLVTPSSWRSCAPPHQRCLRFSS